MSRARATFLVAMAAVVVGACREAAVPPPPSPPPAPAPVADAGLPLAPHADVPELPEDEWRAKIRTAGQPCEKDEIRGRFTEVRGFGPCDRVATHKDDINTGAVLDPLADNEGRTCHYTYCEAITPKRVARPKCEAANLRSTQCIPPPEQGTTLPAPAPYQKCPIGLDRQGPFDPQSTKTNENGECCYSTCAVPVVR